MPPQLQLGEPGAGLGHGGARLVVAAGHRHEHRPAAAQVQLGGALAGGLAPQRIAAGERLATGHGPSTRPQAMKMSAVATSKPLPARRA